MKAIYVSIAAIVAGTAIGWGLTSREFANDGQATELMAVAAGGDAATSAVAAPRAGQPRVEVVGTAEYQFGVMQLGETGKHQFALKNVGDVPLTLTKERTTCKCTLSALADRQLAPGKTTEVTLEWTPKEFAPQFRQTAYIKTNDPLHPMVQLDVVGRVIQTVRMQPDSIVFSNISAGESRTAEVFVYSYRDQEFSMTVDRFSDPTTAGYFDVAIAPLSSEIVAAEQDAKAGVKVTVTVKPGMPIGPLSQTIYLAPLSKDLPELSIPIQGSVAGDISVFAAKHLYNSDRKIVTIGAVKRDKGGIYQLQLSVKGPHAKDVRLKVAEVDPPEVLQVEIDSEHPSSINNGAVLMYPLTIKIPPGSRTVSRLGGEASTVDAKFGKIVIETTHPQIKQFVVHVQFAVEG